jgi:hypothetical protein
MADEQTRSEDLNARGRSVPNRRWVLIAAGLVLAFLLGLLPMWWAKSGVAYELEQAKRDLRREQIHNSLSSAAVYARRGEYETARQNMSSFFTEIQAEIDKPDTSVYSPAERSQMPSLTSSRDDIITLLSRADPASAERLSDLYVTYRSATGGVQP